MPQLRNRCKAVGVEKGVEYLQVVFKLGCKAHLADMGVLSIADPV